jgi:hypothetical protein
MSYSSSILSWYEAYQRCKDDGQDLLQNTNEKYVEKYKQSEDKKAKNTTQKTKNMSNTEPTKKARSEHRSSRRINSSCFL